MRVYIGLDRADLERLAAGEPSAAEQFVAVSDDEEDELAALEAAAEAGAVAVAADVEVEDRPVTWDCVASIHLDADGSGFVAWYAPDELPAVLALLG